MLHLFKLRKVQLSQRRKQAFGTEMQVYKSDANEPLSFDQMVVILKEKRQSNPLQNKHDGDSVKRKKLFCIAFFAYRLEYASRPKNVTRDEAVHTSCPTPVGLSLKGKELPPVVHPESMFFTTRAHFTCTGLFWAKCG